MIDEFAKDNLHGRLRRDRQALLWKLDGLSDYDARRPLTATGTNLLGLVKHVATVEARYFGEVFARPSPSAPLLVRNIEQFIRFGISTTTRSTSRPNFPTPLFGTEI
jgi:hypothetical protein